MTTKKKVNKPKEKKPKKEKKPRPSKTCRVGRPLTAPPLLREHRIVVKCNVEEYNTIVEKADELKLRLSVYGRKAMLNNEITIINADFGKVLFLLSNMANNLNQIARYCNERKELIDNIEGSLEKIDKTILEVSAMANKAIQREEEEDVKNQT